MKRDKIFVIDDEPRVGDTIKEALAEEGFSVEYFENPKKAMDVISSEQPCIVLTDLVMPGFDGIEVTHAVKAINPEINVIVITGHASLDSAIKAIRAGASDYIVKPFQISELRQSVQKALSQKRFPPEPAGQSRSYQEKYQLKKLIGVTPEITEIFRFIEKVSKSDSTIFVMGESGTGKEMVARTIHYRSKRRKGPFVSLNCAALPEPLLESELFGYEKGAFTGATTSKVGLLELAEKGTFFLDEVGDMSLSLQAKLLRILQERVLKRVGGIRDIRVDFRLVAATSKNIPLEIEKKTFREDLFYRLNVIPILLPPLRDRKDDIPLFVRHFLDLFSRGQDKPRQFQLTRGAMEMLTDYPWPGNIRELENMMERLVALTDQDEVDEQWVEKLLHQNASYSSHVSEPITASNALRESVETYERRLIDQALREAHGNKNRAAKKLHLTRQVLQYKVDKYKIQL